MNIYNWKTKNSAVHIVHLTVDKARSDALDFIDRTKYSDLYDRVRCHYPDTVCELQDDQNPFEPGTVLLAFPHSVAVGIKALLERI